MFGLAFLALPIVGAYAVYVDATDREAAGALWWAALTLVVGYGLGPILLGVFLALYLVVHAVEARLKRRRTGTGVRRN